MTVGERIKEKRIELNLSQDELAKKVGYKSRSSIQKIETARHLPLNKVELMASALDCSPSYLMGWEDENGVYIDTTSIPHNDLNEEETEKAVDLFRLYENASPEVRSAVDLLLKSAQSDS